MLCLIISEEYTTTTHTEAHHHLSQLNLMSHERIYEQEYKGSLPYLIWLSFFLALFLSSLPHNSFFILFLSLLGFLRTIELKVTGHIYTKENEGEMMRLCQETFLTKSRVQKAAILSGILAYYHFYHSLREDLE